MPVFDNNLKRSDGMRKQRNVSSRKREKHASAKTESFMKYAG